MQVTRALPWLLLAVTACSSGNSARPPCVSDLECGTGSVCFAEGCGDPLTGIVIEVSGNGVGGQFTHDLPIDDGTLGMVQDLDLGDPLTMVGEFQRDRFYNDPVKLQAVGVSELIPGVTRVFEARIDQPVRGTYSMALGAGKFRVTALPADPAVPPMTVSDVVVRANFSAPAVNFAFPTIEQAITLSGRLLKKVDTSRYPNVEVPLTATGSAMDLQAFDSETNDPLSQRFPVSSGQVGANGNFTMTLSARVNDLKTVLLVATPHDATLPLPTKKFVLNTPLPNTVTLELGDTGPALDVKGQAVDGRGAPVANAQVLLEGTVLGEGTFRSKLATTDAQGAFTLSALQGVGAMRLTIIPPPDSLAAVTTVLVHTPTSSGPLSPAVVTCDDRVTVTGQVLAPGGAAAMGVVVRAVEQVADLSSSRPLPLEGADTVTAEDGTFSLRVDPATWRLEFSTGALPMASRLVVVTSALDNMGQRIMSQALAAPVQLARARTLTGAVTSTSPAKLATPVPWARLRFFRVAPSGTSRTAILLGAAVADEQGHYSVNLPR